MKTKTKAILSLSAVMCFALGAPAFMLAAPANAETVTGQDAPANAETVATPHAVDECNKNLSDAATDYSLPVAVSYDGTYTGTYAIQAYAGLSGAAWIIGGESGYCDFGKGAHPFGSNSDDNRNNFSVTMSIDSTVAGEAFLYLHAETPISESFTVKVNDGEATQTVLGANYGAHFAYEKAYPERPLCLPVTLTQGVNTVTLTTGENYTFWMHSFAVSPTAARIVAPDNVTITQYKICGWSETGGNMAANPDGIGLNAFDNAADYGKTGYAEYKIYAKNAGTYSLGMYVMAGNALANRATLTLNGAVVQSNGQNYVAFDTAAGWGGDSWNYVDVNLGQGENTLRIENCLTNVNAERTEEVAEGAEGSVKVSNWWMHLLSLSKKSSYALSLDTSNLRLRFNPDLRPTAEEIKENLVVYLAVDGTQQETALSAENYDVDVTGNTVTVSYTGSEYQEVQSATISLQETPEGVAHKGKTVDFDGTQSTGLKSWYLNAAIKGEGTGETEGRLFYVITGQPVAQGGYVFGSGGAGASENRQMTLTLRINNTGSAGAYLLKSYMNANNYDLNGAQIKVNDGEYADVNINGPKQGAVQLPFNYEIELAAGENTVELKLCEQYSVWFETFEIAPIAYNAAQNEYKVEDASREGAGCFDTGKGMFAARNADRALKYYVGIETAGMYRLSFKVGSVPQKTLFVSIDGGEEEALTTTGAATVSLNRNLAAGNHTVKVAFRGDGGNVDFSGMTKEYQRPMQSMRVDTSEMELTLENGGNPNFAKLKVYVLYEGDEEEMLLETGYEIDSSLLNNKVAGDYTITVSSTAYPDVKATFTMTVKAVKAVAALEVDATGIPVVANGGTVDFSKLSVTLVYNDGTKLPAMASDYIVTEPEGFSSAKAGEYTFTVAYAKDNGITATFKVTVEEAPKKSGGCKSVVSAGIAGIGTAITVIGAAALCLKKKK